MRTALVFSPHADDVAAFCGGTIAKLAAEGWQIVVARITDDAKDSVGLTVEETVRVNTEEFRAAMKILGVAEVRIRFLSGFARIPGDGARESGVGGRRQMRRPRQVAKGIAFTCRRPLVA